MAGRIKIDSSGTLTPEYTAVRTTKGDIKSAAKAILPQFESDLDSAKVLPPDNNDQDVMKTLLAEISRIPLNFYALQNVLEIRNDEDRFKKCFENMGSVFCGKYGIDGYSYTLSIY